MEDLTTLIELDGSTIIWPNLLWPEKMIRLRKAHVAITELTLNVMLVIMPFYVFGKTVPSLTNLRVYYRDTFPFPPPSTVKPKKTTQTSTITLISK